MKRLQAVLRWLKMPGFRDPDFYIGGKEDPYLLRWWVLPRNPFFNIYLHKFLRDDDDRALHDHPWASCSIILKTGYWEHLPGDVLKWRKPGQVHFRRAEQAHRIQLGRSFHWCGSRRFIEVMPAWTLFLTGPRIREWGFHCPKGWIHWEDFTEPGDSSRIGKGCDADVREVSHGRR